MEAQLLYGDGQLKITLPASAEVGIIKPKKVMGLSSTQEKLLEALHRPIEGKPLLNRAKKGDKVGIIFNDITRATPNKLLIEAIFEALDHIPVEDFTLYNALGTHRQNTEEEIISLISEELYRKCRVVQNNAFDDRTQIYLGRTRRGHEIRLNKDLLQNDLIILTGFIEPHFFAGFSGGGKAIMPGMGGLRTIMHNHGADMIGNPASVWGQLDENPIQQEVREVALKVPNTFLFNVAMNDNKEITGVFAGDLLAAHDLGCSFVKATAMVSVEEPFDIVITSNSGYPLDQNLYQSVKGMSAAAQILKPGGSIIVAAECRDGLPDHGLFGKMLLEAASPQKLLKEISEPGFHQLDQWQLQIIAMILQRAEVCIYSDYLDRTALESRFLNYSEDISETVRDLMENTKGKVRIGILPEGPLTIPYLQK